MLSGINIYFLIHFLHLLKQKYNNNTKSMLQLNSTEDLHLFKGQALTDQLLSNVRYSCFTISGS